MKSILPLTCSLSYIMSDYIMINLIKLSLFSFMYVRVAEGSGNGKFSFTRIYI